MRKSSSIAIMAVVLGLASMAAHAVTASYDALYVFGDSYCDVGNIFTATGGAEPAAPYYDGRFSNGPIWLDHVAGFLGVPLKVGRIMLSAGRGSRSLRAFPEERFRVFPSK